MKKLLLTLSFISIFASTAISQNYKIVEWDVLGISKINTAGNKFTNGPGFHTELRFNINDKLSLGLKYDWHFYHRVNQGVLRGLGISKYLTLTGDYYLFNKLNKRAFIGLAMGALDNQARKDTGEEIGDIGFGLVPRIGYEVGFLLRLTAEYNIAFNESLPNYFAIGIGVNIGGRYKHTE